MKKNLLIVILTVLLIAIELIGCGIVKSKKHSSSDSMDNAKNIDSSEQYNNKAGLDDKKEPDAEMAINEAKEADIEEAKPASQNISDYCKKNDYFDLEGYVTARGAKWYEISECTDSYYTGCTKASFVYNRLTVTIVLVDFKNELAGGYMINITGENISLVSADLGYQSDERIIFDNDNHGILAGEFYAVDDNGHYIRKEMPELLSKVLDSLDQYGTSEVCPLCGGNGYSSTPYIHVH